MMNMEIMSQSNIFSTILWIVLLFGVIGFAIIYFQESLFSTPQGSSTNPDTLSRAVTEGWKTYVNTKYGFEFRYPSNRTAYQQIDAANQRLIPATPESDMMGVAHREGGYVFSGEVQAVTVSVIHETTDARSWFERHTGEYVKQGRVESITSISFVGKRALEIKGESGSDNYYRIIIVQEPSYLIVIHQNAKSTLLDDVVRTFRFTK